MWEEPPPKLVLGPDEVHIWRGNLDLSRERVEKLALTLSTDEVERANRFYFQQHKERFIVGRGTLRTILASYLKTDPVTLQFEYNKRGKPRLGGDFSGHELQFNLSHSEGLVLYGFTRGHLLGIDVEYLSAGKDIEGIAQRFFTPREYAIIKELAEPEKQKAFFRCWTAKEAYLKAVGSGLAGSINSIEVSFLTEEAIELLSIDKNSQAAANWSLLNIPLSQDYIATLAIKVLVSRKAAKMQRLNFLLIKCPKDKTP